MLVVSYAPAPLCQTLAGSRAQSPHSGCQHAYAQQGHVGCWEELGPWLRKLRGFCLPLLVLTVRMMVPPLRGPLGLDVRNRQDLPRWAPSTEQVLNKWSVCVLSPVGAKQQ